MAKRIDYGEIDPQTKHNKTPGSVPGLYWNHSFATFLKTSSSYFDGVISPTTVRTSGSTNKTFPCAFT